MFEVLLNQPRPRAVVVPAPTGDAVTATEARVLLSSALVWGEHCTECAWPTCYSSCSLYTPRPDLKCRRFVDGIVPVEVRTPTGSSHPGMRVGFRQWGKLEATGRVELLDVSHVTRLAARDDAARAALRSAPAPYAWKRRAGQAWPRVRGRATAGSAVQVAPDDVFLVEAVNESDRAVRFTLTIFAGGDGERFFQHGFVLEPGYNVVTVPARQITDHVDLRGEVVVRVEPTVVEVGNSTVFLRLDMVRLAADAPIDPGPAGDPETPKAVKVVVWDLDGTLWDGTLVEDGLEGVRLRPGVRKVIEELDARGVLQSVASKNDPELAREAMDAAGIAEFFLEPRVGWDPKSEGIARIVHALDVGMDTVLFVDDQPFERAEVQAAHPQVRVAAAEELPGLLDRSDLDVPVTAVSRQRRAMYVQEAQRRTLFEAGDYDFDGFLRSCNITLGLSSPDDATAERIYELAQRTNQLNYSGERLTREEVDAMVRGEGDVEGVVLAAADRFGDYGVIGFATVDRARFVLTSFYMSCRVQRKRIEHAFFALLLEAGRRQGFDQLRVRHRPTPRNRPAVDVLASLGAQPLDQDGGAAEERYFVLPSTRAIEGADIVTVVDEVLHTWGTGAR